MNKVKSFFIKRKKLFVRIVSVTLVVSFFLGLFTLFDNFRLDVDHLTFDSVKIPKSFNGYKIAHISDYHSRKSKIINNKIFETLNAEKPDIIIITGDLIDCRSVDIDTAIDFAKKLVNITDVYFVSGNHEGNYLIQDQWGYMSFMEKLRATGVKVLTNETHVIQKADGSAIYLHGIDDPYLVKDRVEIDVATASMCNSLTLGDGYNILLAHHPEQLSIYSEYGFDLVFSGHAHGGQITLFGLGLFAPDQESLPDYTSGVYNEGDTSLVLSRGIGYSLAPIRFFCAPHLIIAELKSK